MRSGVCFTLTVLLFSFVCVEAIQAAPPNPYGVAGYGVLDDLGMPADCLQYDWNNLHTDNLIQMCRPNHYYDYIGIPHRWWGWNENTGEINDPVRFDQWILDHPGKIWIISNEPDLQSQDGLSREQYAQMYKVYYDFISQRDATARFCIGAITGGSTTDRLNYTKGWYEYVMNYYETTYGQPMPIDIWNIHSYVGATQIEDPDQPIRDFVEPFVEWCHTVDGGRYAGAEVWITELPIGEWMGALSEEWIIWFARRYMPRLEQTGIDRWFWFVSRDSGEWATVALVKSYGVSPLGEAYAELANGYPNDVPPVEPYVPDPTPALFEDDFSAGPLDDPWMIKAGVWSIDSGTLHQSRTNFIWSGETCVLQYDYADFDARFKLRVNDAPGPENWAGFLFHASSRFHWHPHGGYLVYLRQNGTVGLFNAIDSTMAEVPNAVADAGQWQDLRVQMDGWRIKVWLNGSLVIDHLDAARRYASGYSMFQVYKTDSSFDDVRIWNTANTPPTVSSTTISNTWLAAEDSAPYSVGVTATDADGVDEIVAMHVVLDDGTHAAEHARGQLAWGATDADITAQGGEWTLMGDAAGGGRWAWRLNDWGSDDYITPVSAETSVNGDQRAVTFTFTVKPAWATAAGQAVRGYARDVRGDDSTWILGATRYDVHRYGPGDLDGDGDADQSDFGLFQSCYTGAGISQDVPSCVDALLDSDNDVDSDDFTFFQNCMTGPGIPVDPDCLD